MMSPTRMIAWGLASGIALDAFTLPARAEYLIQPGDTLEIAVAGIPDLKQRSVVTPDGEVTAPMIRPVKVAGLGLSAVQTLIKEQLSRKLYQQRMPDGRDSTTAIGPDAVMITIAEYRPVYLNGDVTKPGAQNYLPGMTVRQAVALAGGYEIMRFRMNNPFLESADLRNDYQTLWMQYVKLQAKIWRLKAQADGKGDAKGDARPAGKVTDGRAPDARDKASSGKVAEGKLAEGKVSDGKPLIQTASLESMTQAPLPQTVLDSMRTHAREQLALANERFAAEETYLKQVVRVSDDQLALLRERQVKDDENVQVDTTDYNKLKEFAERGNVPMTRLSESRRLFLFSATQSLQTNVQIVNTMRERNDAQRRLAVLGETTRAAILEQIEQATVELDGVRSRLQSVSEKITYTGVIRSQLSRGGGARPVIRVIHSEANGGGTDVATEDTPVMPGDTIEVALHTEVPHMEAPESTQ